MLPRLHSGSPSFAPWSHSQKEAYVCTHWIQRLKPKLLRPCPRMNQTPASPWPLQERSDTLREESSPLLLGKEPNSLSIRRLRQSQLLCQLPGNFRQVASLLQACETRRTAPPGSISVTGSSEETNADIERKVPSKV